MLASACLPHLFQAVEIDGTPYWDGGYLGNPAIFPLFATTETEDVLIVQINPVARHETPTSSREIMSRLNEVTFNAPLMGELRAIEFVARLIDSGHLARGKGAGQYRRINVHRVVLESFRGKRSTPTAGSTPTTISSRCCANGQRATRRFLDKHFDDIGVQGTVDLRAEVQAEWA